MTPEQLKVIIAIKERHSRATPGPWKLWNGYTIHTTGREDICGVVRIGPEEHRDILCPLWNGLVGSGGADIQGSIPNLEFVACAWQDIMDLLAVIELTGAVKEHNFRGQYATR